MCISVNVKQAYNWLIVAQWLETAGITHKLHPCFHYLGVFYCESTKDTLRGKEKRHLTPAETGLSPTASSTQDVWSQGFFFFFNM